MTRWPIIRHLRWALAAWRLRAHVRRMYRAGLGLGRPTPHDLRIIDAIWRGDA